jgi:hypothetical protein
MVMDDAEPPFAMLAVSLWDNCPTAGRNDHTEQATSQQRLININELLRLKVFNGDG